MSTTSWTMETKSTRNLFSAVKRWLQQLRELISDVLDWPAQVRREKRRQDLIKDAERRQALLDLHDRLRQRLHERLKEK